MNIQVSLFHDCRRAKKGKLYPVKIRVWDGYRQKAKLYPTHIDLTEKEYASAWVSQKPRKEFKELRIKLDEIKLKAVTVAKELTPFSFENFERRLYRKANDGTNVKYHYTEVINQLKKKEQFGTASTYELSLKSFTKFLQNTYGKNIAGLTFQDITPEWLNDYETYMTKTESRSLTTVSMYVRSLRAIFNRAIELNEIRRQLYPFGKRKYKVPFTRNTKKALSQEELSKLFNAKPKTEEQQRAKDFWFFSYACNGMNIKDIALLRNKDIDGNTIKFFRAKTLNTSKADLRAITVHLTDFAKGVISIYGTGSKEPNALVFPIISETMSVEKQQNVIKNFTRSINQNLKILSKSIGLPDAISTYWARHSFATNAITTGKASMEFVQESLGHNNIKTTQNYFAGFDNSIRKEISNKLMDFTSTDEE